MFLTQLRLFALSCAALLIFPFVSDAFDTPLSDTAVREAYFLGQHHDEVFTDFLQKYVVALPLPKNGPHIAAISLFTPYAVTALNSNQRSGSYSAQQAQADHGKQPEFVRIVVQIWFTASYGEYIIHPAGSRSGSTQGYEPRSPDFWRQFRLRVFQKDRLVIPLNAKGEPNFNCGDDSGCDLVGAMLTFEYPANSFTEDTITVLVTPPEGDLVSVDFDPTAIR